jgi:hypothetical protein
VALGGGELAAPIDQGVLPIAHRALERRVAADGAGFGRGVGKLTGRGPPPSEATKERKTELFFSASWPAAMTMSTWSGSSLNEVSTALSAAARGGSSWSNAIRPT